MAHQLFQLPKVFALSTSVAALPGSKLQFYLTGTSTPTDTYTTSALSVAHANPVVADAAGVFAPIYLNPSIAYKVTYTTAADVLIYTVDPVNDSVLSQAIIGSLLYPQTAAELAAGVTPTNYAYPPGDLRRYGGVGDGTTSNNTALANLRAVCSEGVAGYIPAGTFAYSTGPNWGVSGITLRGERGAIIKHTGTGVAFLVDVGTDDGSVLDGLNISDLVIQGNANTTDAFYTRGLCRSSFRRIEVRTGCTGAAFASYFGVSNHYDTCIISGNIAAITTSPAYGFYLGDSGVGYQTANCTFTNCIAEGFEGIGCKLAFAQGNTFTGGTFEGVDVGLDIDVATYRNQFNGVWFEANDDNDIIDRGTMNQYINCVTVSNTAGDTVDIRGAGAVFVGGFHRLVDLDAASNDTSFFGVSFSDNVSLGVTGTGTYKLFGCNEADTNQEPTATVNDKLGTRATVTLTLTGCTTSPTVDAYCTRVDDLVTIDFRSGVTATSNTTAATLTGLTAPFRPAAAEQAVLVRTIDNGVIAFAIASIGTGGTITLFKDAALGAFTNSGTKGIDRCTANFSAA